MYIYYYYIMIFFIFLFILVVYYAFNSVLNNKHAAFVLCFYCVEIGLEMSKVIIYINIFIRIYVYLVQHIIATNLAKIT